MGKENMEIKADNMSIEGVAGLSVDVITIPVSRYEELVRKETAINTLQRFLDNGIYFGDDDMRMILDLKKPSKADADKEQF